jgi:hypothetical protein
MGYIRSVAQQYPVTVQVQLLQPVSPQLTNLYGGTQARMIVTLLNTDLRKPSLSVRLRFTIKGTTAILRNKDYGVYPTIMLDAGVPTQLSLNDLAPYFQVNNLDASGISPAQLVQNSRLPDGYYTFCVEVIEINSGQLISSTNMGCSPPVWLSTSEPPMLNLPMKGSGISFREPLNLIFNWTPRHMSSANAAFQTEYEFTLSELWDTIVAPEAAFLSTAPLYQTVTTATTLLYGPAEPPLIPGKRYGWRIRAKAKMGIDEFDVFQNNGYSEIFWVLLQQDCQPPQQVVATIENGAVNVNWIVQPKMSEYIVEYREANNDEAEWFNVKTSEDHVTIYDAVPGKSYEYRVGGYCIADVKTMGDLHGFKMPEKKNEVNKNCGLLPDIKLENQTAIKSLRNGDQIRAGDFPVRLMTVEGSGSFKGTGYVMVPFLSDAKVKVRFSKITVNTNYQLLTGVIETTFDSTETQVAKVGDVVNAIKDLASVVIDLAHLTIDADYLVVKELAEEIRKMAEDELPEELKDRIINAADNLEASKKAYDEAKKEYDSATTPEEKATAKEKMKEAEKAFEAAKEEVKAVNKEKEKLVEEITNLLVKAVRALKSQYTESKRKTINDNIAVARTQLETMVTSAKKSLMNGRNIPAAGTVSADAFVIFIDSTSTAPGNSEFDRLSIAYKNAELEKKQLDAVDILDRDILNKTYYALLMQVFKNRGTHLVDYIVEEKENGTDEAVIVEELKVRLKELLLNLLSK